MNKRSKSSIVLKYKQKLQQKDQQLEILKDKIKESQPILQTIYTKVKNKQQFITKQLYTAKRKIATTRNLANQYMELYQQGLSIIQQNKIQDQYAKTKTNYRHINKQAQQRTNNKNKDKTLYEIYRQKFVKKINPQNKILQIKAKQISDQMKEGIQQARVARQKSQNTLSKYQKYNKQISNTESIQRFIQLQKSKLKNIK